MTDMDLAHRVNIPTLLFGGLEPQSADALLGLIALYQQDTRPDKIDLGVGVYRDDVGATPVMRAVKSAEQHLAANQSSKSYLGAEGDTQFVKLLASIVFGDTLAKDERLTGVQTPGGTGALRLAAELVARGSPDARIWIGAPTWPNHCPIFTEAGIEVRSHHYYDALSGEIDFEAMIAGLDNAYPGDVVLLHGCCHNPTGTGFSQAQWQTISSMLAARKLVPLIDLAYQGLGAGLDGDAWATRLIVSALPEAIIAYSCDKNFGLYRDRVGALWVKGNDGERTMAIRDNILTLARSIWSMPPDHGAAVVRVILEDTGRSADWRRELEAMRTRIARLRAALAGADPRLAPLGRQNGMFAMLPLSREAVLSLRGSHGIYMADSGRINIAGLRAETVELFVAAIAPHLNR